LIDLLHLELRITERFVLNIANQYLEKFDVNTKEEKANQFNLLMSSYNLPELYFGVEKKKFYLGSIFNGRCLDILREVMPQLVNSFEGTSHDQRCWDFFQQAIKLASQWNKGNALSIVPLEKAYQFIE